jgi:hypothetical protein
MGEYDMCEKMRITIEKPAAKRDEKFEDLEKLRKESRDFIELCE